MQQFPNTTVNLDVPCDATINGTCFTTPTVNECMEQCTAPQCYWGTWNARDRICKPIYYSTHRDLNPGFILKPDNDTTTFIDGSFFTLPAERGDRMFFYDRVRVQNVETGLVLKPDVRLRMTRPFIPHPGLNFIPITTRTPVLLYDRQLDSVLRVEGRSVNWYKAIDFLNQDYEAFFLEPTNANADTDKPQQPRQLAYSDTFRIRTAAMEYVALPPLTQYFTPRLNDLIVSNDPAFDLPRTFRFLYVPTNPTAAT
jgi:hypothetical protein